MTQIERAGRGDPARPVATATIFSSVPHSTATLPAMKVKVYSRTAGQLDWERCVLDLHRLPAVTEFIAVRPDERTEALWHQVQAVVHIPSGSKWEAEVYCTKCSPNHPRRIAYGSTMSQHGSTQEQGGQDEPQSKLLTEEQAAEAAGVDRKTIRRLIESKRLPAADYGSGKKHMYRIHRDDLTRVMKDPPAPVVTQKPHRQFSDASAAYLPWNRGKDATKPTSMQQTSKPKRK